MDPAQKEELKNLAAHFGIDSAEVKAYEAIVAERSRNSVVLQKYERSERLIDDSQRYLPIIDSNQYDREYRSNPNQSK